MKQLYIIAGSNGSGKSTIAKVLLPEDDIVYVNPDDIAKSLNPIDIGKVKVEAGKLALKKINELLDKGESFAIESTLSGTAYLKILSRAKSLGYDTTIAYVYVDSPAMCINRIAVRVKHGGHHVPDQDVIRRYDRSKFNFLHKYQSAVNHWLLYYTGGTECSLVAHGNGETTVICKERYDAFMEGVWKVS